MVGSGVGLVYFRGGGVGDDGGGDGLVLRSGSSGRGDDGSRRVGDSSAGCLSALGGHLRAFVALRAFGVCLTAFGVCLGALGTLRAFGVCVRAPGAFETFIACVWALAVCLGASGALGALGV